MFTLQVKTNRPWSLNHVVLSETSWTNVGKKSYANLKDAEVELSYLQQQFLDIEGLKNLEVNYRILNQKQEVLFEKKTNF